MRFCWKGLNNHLIIHPLANPAFRTGHCHTYGLATWASVLSGLCNPFRRVHSTKHQQPHFNNRGKCMMDLCFLIKLKFCIWLTESCTEGGKNSCFIFCLFPGASNKLLESIFTVGFQTLGKKHQQHLLTPPHPTPRIFGGQLLLVGWLDFEPLST